MAKLSGVCCLVLLALGSHADPTCTDDDVSSLLQVSPSEVKADGNPLQNLKWKAKMEMANVKAEAQFAKAAVKGGIIAKGMQNAAVHAYQEGQGQMMRETELAQLNYKLQGQNSAMDQLALKAKAEMVEANVKVHNLKAVAKGKVAVKGVEMATAHAVQTAQQRAKHEAFKQWRQAIHAKGTAADQYRKQEHQDANRVLKEEDQKQKAIHKGERQSFKAIRADDKAQRKAHIHDIRDTNNNVNTAERNLKGVEQFQNKAHQQQLKAAHGAENMIDSMTGKAQKQIQKFAKAAIKTGEKNLVQALNEQKKQIPVQGEVARKQFQNISQSTIEALADHNEDVKDVLAKPEQKRKLKANTTAQAEAAAVSPEGRTAARDAAIRIKDESIAQAQQMYDDALKVQESAIRQQAQMIAAQQAKAQAKSDAQAEVVRQIQGQSGDED